MENFWTKPLLYKLPGEHQIRTSLWKVSTFQNDNDLPTIEQTLKPSSSLSLVSPSPLGSTASTEYTTTTHNVVVETSRKTPQQLNFISCSSDSDTPPRPLTPPLTQASSTSTSTSSSSVTLPLSSPSLTTPNPPSSTTSSTTSSSPSGTHTTPISPPPRSSHTTRTTRMPPQHPPSTPNPKPTNLTNTKKKKTKNTKKPITQTKKRTNTKKKNPRSWLRRGIQDDCEVVPMKTGVLYIYRGDHRRVEFVRKK